MSQDFPFTLLDLTHVLLDGIPTWDLNCGYAHSIKTDYDKALGNSSFRIHTLTMPAGAGTHMDAPAHRFLKGLTIDQLPINHLLCPAICINVSDIAHEAYLVSPDDILLFEKQHGKIPADSIVLFYTGWDHHWHDPKKYHNHLQFPSLSEELALLLLERNIRGVGIDTLSPDVGSSDFPVHTHLLGANKYIIENVAHASKLPPTGAYVLVAAINGGDLTEAPVRLIGFI